MINFKPIYNENGNIVNTKELKEAILNYRRSIKLDFDNPQTLQDKINWLKVYDVSNTKAIAADKIKVHEYCKEKLGKDICIPILKVYEKPEDINLDELPNKFVLKCNHGYAMNIICNDKTNNEFVTLKKHNVNNQEDCINLCKRWLNQDFGLESLQLHYSLIDRKCFVEEFVNDGHETLTDYKFWCFNGEPIMIEVISNRYTNKLHDNMYDMNFNILDVEWNSIISNKNELDDKPLCLDEMINYSKILSKDFKLVRVDFYVIDNKPYLGELTFTPGNGYIKFKNSKQDLYWSSKLKL